jgi:hypothetical protein
MNDEIYFGGVKYISATSAATSSGFTRDYIGRLCRLGKINGKRIGKNWFIDNSSLQSFAVSQESLRVQRRESLAQMRTQEYKSAISLGASVAQKNPAPATIHTNDNSYVKSPYQYAELASNKKPFSPKPSVGNTVSAGASSLLEAPAGVGHAALAIAHAPLHTVTPFVEVLHKLTALLFVVMILGGTYALINPTGTVAALETMHQDAVVLASLSHRVLSGDTSSAFAAVADAPSASVSYLGNLFADIANSISTHVGSFI